MSARYLFQQLRFSSQKSSELLLLSTKAAKSGDVMNVLKESALSHSDILHGKDNVSTVSSRGSEGLGQLSQGKHRRTDQKGE